MQMSSSKEKSVKYWDGVRSHFFAKSRLLSQTQAFDFESYGDDRYSIPIIPSPRRGIRV
jgi:hypothetical protein